MRSEKSCKYDIKEVTNDATTADSNQVEIYEFISKEISLF